MMWGHKVSGKEGPVAVTRAEYNQAFNVSVPDQPPFPEQVRHVWEWWQHLSGRRSPGFESIAPITYEGVAHWVAVTRTRITRSEIRMILDLDDVYLAAIGKERAAQQDRNKDK